MKDKYVFYNHFGGGNDINIIKLKNDKTLNDPSTILLKIKEISRMLKKIFRSCYYFLYSLLISRFFILNKEKY